jgi:predicted nucleotide-binding protein (sugar kinase/HSP70/actin superfamily)
MGVAVAAGASVGVDIGEPFMARTSSKQKAVGCAIPMTCLPSCKSPISKQVSEGLKQAIHVAASIVTLDRDPHQFSSIPIDQRYLDAMFIVQP